MAGRININHLFMRACDRPFNHDNRSNSFLSDFLVYDYEPNDQFEDILLTGADESSHTGSPDELSGSVVTPTGVNSLLELSARVVGKHKSCQELDSYQPPLDEPLLKKVAYWSFPPSEKCVEPVAALWYNRKARTGSDGKMIYEDWEAGKKLVRNNCIIKMWQVGFMATAVMRKNSSQGVQRHTRGSQSDSPIDSDDTDSQEPVSFKQKNEPEEDECVKVCLTFEKQEITSSSCTQCDVGWCEHVVAAVLYRIQHPKQVTQYAPITDVLASLNRDQLQKLLQYVILEDKVNVLDIIVKYLDEIRDVNSSLNETQGAPDPSFGLDESVTTTMDISVKSFVDNLYDTLDTTEEQCSKCYTDGYDWSCKVTSDFHNFVSKILHLQKGGHYKAAANLFNVVIKELIDNMETVSEENYIGLQEIGMTVHDLSHMLSLCILSPLNDHCIDLEEIYKTVMEFCGKIPENVEAIPFSSEWAELPRAALGIADLYDDHTLSEEGNKLKCRLLGDILTTKYIPPWPEELTKLLEGQVEWKSSLYSENIVLMLTRIECLMQLSDETNCDQVLKVLPIALRKLTMLAQKHSLLGEYVDAWQDVFDLDHSIPALRESKYQKCKNVVKRRKLTHYHFEPELTQSQITYALLFCLHLKKVCEDASGKVFEGPLTTAPFCFLALELSRCRLYDGNLDPTEQSWLDKLEKILSKQIECQYGISQPPTQRTGTLVVEDNNMILWYLEALGSDGDTYYGHQVPMQLLKILFHLINKKQLQSTLSEKIVKICAAVIQRIRQAVSESATVCARIKDFDMVGDLVEMFFECLDVKSTLHLDLLIQVLQNLTAINLKYENFQKRAFAAFYKKNIDIDCHQLFMWTSFHFALNSISTVAPATYDLWRDNVLAHIKKCIHIIGLPALQDILKCQSKSTPSVTSLPHQDGKTFSTVELGEILSLLKPKILACDTMSRDVYSVIKQCISEPDDIHNLPELLALFKSNSKESSYFEQCVDEVLEQYPRISSSRLFSIAKLYEDKRKERLTQQSPVPRTPFQPHELALDLSNKVLDGDLPRHSPIHNIPHMPDSYDTQSNSHQFLEEACHDVASSSSYFQALDLSLRLTDEKVLVIIEKAFEQLDSEHRTEDYCFHKCQETHVKWAYEYCTADGVLWSDAFVHLIDVIRKHGRAHPLLVLMLFDVVDKNLIGKTQLNTLKLSLIAAYKDYHIMKARHVRSPSYNRVINNVRKDRDKFIEIFGMENSGHYDCEVVDGIKAEYRTRRRLVRLLEEAFPTDLKNDLKFMNQ